MSGVRMQYDEEFKKNAVKLSYAIDTITEIHAGYRDIAFPLNIDVVSAMLKPSNQVT